MRRVLVFGFALACALSASATGSAKPRKPHVPARAARRAPSAASERGPFAWCADGIEAVGDGICHIDGGQPEGRSTLVIFLHGAIARDVKWQWTQEQALLRQAKQSKFEAIFPRAPLSEAGHVWPGTAEAQRRVEGELIASWSRARKRLEARRGKPYDEVFLMGFSSGAYYVSSLANRGAVKADGFGVFAGGAIMRYPVAEATRKSPFFVGVCATDEQTAPHGRGLGGSLASLSWPHKVDERRVGHMYADGHVAAAIAYLRAARDARR